MKKDGIKIIIALILFIFAMAVKFENVWINNGIFIISYIIVGFEIIKNAIRNIFRGEVFDENFLMAIATIGAFAIGEFPEAVAVMLFYQIGELFQSYAVDKSRKSITNLMDIRPDYANAYRNGNLEKVNPEEVQIGETIVIKPGEKVPLDGKIIEGNTTLDTKALTGEALPREVVKGEDILSGCINLNGTIKVEVTKKFGESTVSKILNLVENASSKKSKSENFITKFARYYTPAVVIIAVVLAIVPPLIVKDATFQEWIYRALSFLVVSCPCALVISVPLSFFGGIGGASKMGILVKGSNYLEALASTEIAVFDKTGTLTEGVFEVQKVEVAKADNNFETKSFLQNNTEASTSLNNEVERTETQNYKITQEELLKITAYAENYSNHPISVSVKKAYGKEIDESQIISSQELSGRGIEAQIGKQKVLVGNEKLMSEKKIKFTKCNDIGTVLYIAIDGKYVGHILIADKIKADSQKAIEGLKRNNIKQIVMLTGDRKEVGEAVAKEIGINTVYTELLPDGKVAKVEELLKTKSEKGKLIFVGDGINDAPVLAISDIGIAMGGIGADSSIEAADVVIMTDEPSKIINAIQISKKTMKIVKENIIFAIAVKILVLILSALGISTMWQAVFADVGVSILAILNAIRILYTKF